MRIRAILCCLLSLFLFEPSAFPQGHLAPPGPPGETMKSLEQIASTGIAINSTNTPGDAAYQFVITSPGNYFLTGNLEVTAATAGIRVTAPGVTIDLNGFEISRKSGNAFYGILIATTADRCAVKNGGVRGFASGVECEFAVGNTPRSGSFRNLTATGCSVRGMQAGEGWLVEGCTAHNNSGLGISANGAGCVVTGCASYNNQGF